MRNCLRVITMDQVINTKELRASLPQIVNNVRHGESYTVLYRSRPAFRIVPVEEADTPLAPDKDPLFEADALGETTDGFTSVDHDRLLYVKQSS